MSQNKVDNDLIDLDAFGPPIEEDMVPSSDPLDSFGPPIEEDLVGLSEEVDPVETPSNFVEELSPLQKSAAVGGGLLGPQKAIGLASEKAAPVVEKGIQESIGSLGRLTPEQIGKIRAEPAIYREVGDLQKVTEDLADTAEDIKSKGIQAAKSGDALVTTKDLKVPKKRLLKGLGSEVEKISFDLQKGSKSNIPEALINEFKSLKNKTVDPEIAKVLESEVDFLTNVKSPQGKQLTSLLKKISGKASYNKSQGLSDLENLMKGYRESIRKSIASQDPEFAVLKNKSFVSMQDQRVLKDILGLKPDAKGNFESSSQLSRKLTSLMKDSNAENLGKLQSVLAKYDSDDIIKKADLSVIKSLVKNKGIDISGTSLTKAGFQGALAKNLTGIPGIGGLVTLGSTLKQAGGTKAQELLALAGSSLPGKAIKGVAKTAGKALPLVGAGVTYAAARGEGETPGQAAATTIGDELMDLATAAPATAALLAAGAPVTGAIAGGVAAGALAKEAFTIGPIGAKAGTLQAKLESGEKLSKKERQILEDQRERQSKELAPKFNEATDASSAKVSAVAEKIKTDPKLNNKYKTYLPVLEKAAEAPDRSRASILFGLYQQPAFRQLIKDMEKDKKD